MTRPAAIALLLALSSAGCLAPATLQPATIETAAPPVADVAVVAEPAPNRVFHMRILDARGDLVWSSWPHENGSLITQWGHLDAAEPDAPLNMSPDKLPAVLAPIVQELRLAAPESELHYEKIRLPPAQARPAVLPPPITIAAEGTLPADEAEALFAGARHGLTVDFAGVVPVRIDRMSSEDVAYEILLDQVTHHDVPRTHGLALAAERIGTDITFTLEAAFGAFTVSGPCGIGPYVIDPGFYYTDAIGAWRHVPSGFDHVLGGRIVQIGITVIE